MSRDDDDRDGSTDAPAGGLGCLDFSSIDEKKFIANRLTSKRSEVHNFTVLKVSPLRVKHNLYFIFV